MEHLHEHVQIMEGQNGWEDWNNQERASYLEAWCDEHCGRRPNQKSNDPMKVTLANWMYRMARRHRRQLYQPCFDKMRQFPWWNEWLEILKESTFSTTGNVIDNISKIPSKKVL